MNDLWALMEDEPSDEEIRDIARELSVRWHSGRFGMPLLLITVGLLALTLPWVLLRLG